MGQAIDQKLKYYDQVTKSFAPFFNDADLRTQLATKAHLGHIELL